MVGAFGSNGVSVLLGDGGGNFGAFTLFGAQSNTIFVDVADLNSDGNVDIVASNFNANSISVLLGNGAGGFAAAVHYDAGQNPYGISIGDVNGDGVLDVVTANAYGQSISLFFGKGDGSFEGQVTRDTGSVPTIIVIQDINNLGIADIVVAELGTSSVTVMLNEGSKVDSAALGANVYLEITVENVDSFQLTGIAFTDSLPSIVQGVSAVSTTEGCGTLTVTTTQVACSGGVVDPGKTCRYVALLNGVVAGSSDTSVTVSTNNFSPTTSSSTLFEVVDSPFVTRVLTTQPLAGGIPDNTVKVGQPFTLLITIENRARDVILREVRFKEDLTAFNVISSSFNSLDCNAAFDIQGTEGVFQGQVGPAVSDSCFVVIELVAPSPGSFTIPALTVTSFNGPTVVAPALTLQVQSAPAITVRHLRMRSTFAQHVFEAGDFPLRLAAIKTAVGFDERVYCVVLNRDSNSTTFLTTPETSLDFSITSVFQATNWVPPLPVEFASPLAVAFSMNPGVFQYAVTNRDSNTVWFSSEQLSLRSLSGSPRGIVVGDFDENSVSNDYAVAVHGSNQVAIFIGGAGGGVSGPTYYDAGVEPHEIVAGDFNGDGRQDLAVTNESPRTLTILLKQSGGGFAIGSTYATKLGPYRMKAGLLNDDAHLDIVVGCVQGTVMVFMGNGDGTFRDPREYSVSDNLLGLELFDFDVDGLLDVATSEFSGNTLTVHRNFGDGRLVADSTFNVGSSRDIIAVDVNRDGRDDLIITNSGSNNVTVLTSHLTTESVTSVPSDTPVVLSIELKNPYEEAVTNIEFEGLRTDNFENKNAAEPTIVGLGCAPFMYRDDLGDARFNVRAGSVPPLSSCMYNIPQIYELKSPNTTSLEIGIDYVYEYFISGDGTERISSNISIVPLIAPTFELSFSEAFVKITSTTTLEILIINPNAAPIRNAEFSMATGRTEGVSITRVKGSCTGHSVTLNEIRMINGLIPAGDLCLYHVELRGKNSGTESFSGTLTSRNANPADSNASVEVTLTAPVVLKEYRDNTNSIITQTKWDRSFTVNVRIENPNDVPLTGVGFTDFVPSPMVCGFLPDGSSSCGTQSIGGLGQFVVSGGTIPARSNCIHRCIISVSSQPGAPVLTTNTVNNVVSNEVISANSNAALLTINP